MVSPRDAGDHGFGLTRPPSEIIFGYEQRHSIGHLTSQYGKRALICTDERMVATGDFRDILEDLKSSGISAEVFENVEAELPTENVTQCAEGFKGRQIDVVLGVGGGSCIDHAKVAALLLAYGGRLADYYGELQVPGPTLPVIAMPTTAGTGSEVTPVAVLADPDRAMKVGISSPHLIPRVAIVDPHFALGCPPALTAHAGVDALTHCVEAFTATRRKGVAELSVERVFVGKNIFSDAFALMGMRLIGRSLISAIHHGDRRDAREDMQLAALYGGLALATAGTASAHALQYPIGALTHTHHGAGVGTLLPYVMAYNLPARRPEFAEIARALGGLDTGAVESDPGELGVRCVAGLLRDAGIPTSLADFGVRSGDLDAITEQAMTVSRLIQNNPRPLDRTALRLIVGAALDGDFERILAMDPVASDGSGA